MSAGATIAVKVASPYLNDPLRDTKARLWNWGRWTRKGLGPNLGYPSGVPWAKGWIPAQAWDRAGWGDIGPPEPPPMPVDYRDALVIDAGIKALWGSDSYWIIKRHYHCDIRQGRDDLDRAIRALIHNL
jgi:hypothetical protein